MNAKRAILVLAAALVLGLPLSSTVGQEGKAGKEPPAPSREEAGSGVEAVVWHTDGTKTEIRDALLKEEQIGIISLAKVPTDVYRAVKGKGTITVSLGKIQRIDIVGDTVRITGDSGEPVDGMVDKNGRFFLLGKIGIGTFEINFADVRTITFAHPKGKQMHCEACKRYYVQDWKYCPYEGALLKVVK